MRIALGENSKLTVHPSERKNVRIFYREILGCPVTKESERIDIFKIGDDFYLGIMYDESALSHKDSLKAIWLELNVEKVEVLKQNILKAGIKEIEHWDKEHFYFQAPGGQVFRLAGSNEDMTKWQH